MATERILSLSGVPADIELRLRSTRTRLAACGLLQIAETRSLVDLIEGAGADCLVLKGAPLSMRIYGTPTQRDSRDVDILIAPHSLPRVEAILAESGFRLEKPKGRGGIGRTIFRRYSHDYLFRAPSGVLVEVKLRLHPTRSLLPLEVSTVLERRVQQPLPGTSLPVLNDADLLLYLSTHGARHCWFRLKWLADIAALAPQFPGEGLEALVDATRRQGCEVPLLEALELAHDWLGSEIPPPILRQAEQHPLVRKRRPLVAAAVAEHTFNPFALRDFERMVDRSEYWLRDDMCYRLALFERQTMVHLRAALLGRG